MMPELKTSAAAQISSACTSDPDEFANMVEALNGPCKVRPRRRSRFRGDAEICRLDGLSLARIRMSNLEYMNPAGTNDISTAIPLTSRFEATDGGENRCFSGGHAHVLEPNRAVKYASDDGTAFVVNIGLRDLTEASSKLSHSRERGPRARTMDLSLMTSRGAQFLRNVASLWAAAHESAAASESIVLPEKQAEVVESFLLATSLSDSAADADISPPSRMTATGLTRAEEWICANVCRPITRTELCEVADLNVRTLTRGFEHRYGLGPIAFTRARRLEATYRALLAAEPDSASVTDIAYDHGFAHLGRFAIEYRRAFGELPSTTLRN